MKLEIIRSEYFTKEFKRLAKRYRSLVDDYEALLKSLKSNPMQGVEIAPNIRKIRMAVSSKGRGKSGGARVITFNALVSEQDGKVYLLLIYDKSDTPNVKLKVVQDIVTELNLQKFNKNIAFLVYFVYV